MSPSLWTHSTRDLKEGSTISCAKSNPLGHNLPTVSYLSLAFFRKVVFINIHPNPVSVRCIPLLTYFHSNIYNRSLRTTVIIADIFEYI